MTSLSPREHLAIVSVAQTATGHCGWSAVVVSPSGSRITTGQLRDATKSEAALVGLAEVLRLLPATGNAQLVLPDVGDVPLSGALPSLNALQARQGSTTTCLSGDSDLEGSDSRLVATAKNLAETEAARAQDAA